MATEKKCIVCGDKIVGGHVCPPCEALSDQQRVMLFARTLAKAQVPHFLDDLERWRKWALYQGQLAFAGEIIAEITEQLDHLIALAQKGD